MTPFDRCKPILGALILLVGVVLPAAVARAQERFGHIEVRCETDIKVFLDNKFVGVSDVNGLFLRQVPVGPHVVRIEKDGYQPQNSDTFLLEADQVYLFEAVKMEAALEPESDENEEVARGTGSLVIQTIPVECLVTLFGVGLTGNDEEIVKTQDRWTANGVRSGRYLATFSAMGVEHKEIIKNLK